MCQSHFILKHLVILVVSKGQEQKKHSPSIITVTVNKYHIFHTSDKLLPFLLTNTFMTKKKTNKTTKLKLGDKVFIWKEMFDSGYKQTKRLVELDLQSLLNTSSGLCIKP